ncbi:hypothetical protein GCWU000324_00313 [Kingella oralis ATCC 51147]|uniref:Uncharacterized protein n=1 Tax=Kingella oralis ATCC 51147 TaxID=629741 RepID=C4GHI0_9NEIS|nr:hypothetical protein GCWU000324_00313 [Kingella oralis ATCC 51147]
MAGGAGETITFLFNFFSTGIKATPNGSGKPKTLWRSWKPKNIVAAIPPFRRSENQYIDFRLPFLFLN